MWRFIPCGPGWGVITFCCLTGPVLARGCGGEGVLYGRQRGDGWKGETGKGTQPSSRVVMRLLALCQPRR